MPERCGRQQATTVRPAQTEAARRRGLESRENPAAPHNMEKIESEPKAREITAEFEGMSTTDFIIFLHSLKNEPSLSITVDWHGVDNANRLKAFLQSASPGQKRYAVIRATEKQRHEAANAFSSGVKWIKVE